MNSFAVVAERIRCRVCCRVLPACLFVLFAGARIGNAAESELSLDAAIALALTRAPMIEAREAGIAAATEEVARAAALPDPMLALGVQNLPIAGADAYSLDAEGMTMRSIGITQALPSRAKREARRGSALAFQSEADATRSATVLETKQAVASAWIALWAAERERSLIEELREQARLAVAASKARLGGGAGTASDALAARAAELELDNRLDDAEATVEQARAGLARWIADAAGRAIATSPDFSELPHTQSELLEQIDRQAPLRVWDARESSADAALAMANAERRPDWSIGAGFAKRGGDASNVVWLEVGIGLPVFTANRQDRGINARRSDLQAIRAAREDARRSAEESVRKDLALWSALGRKATRFRESILPLAHDRSATALAAYSGGADLDRWLVAQRDEIASRIEYAKLLAEWGQAWAALTWLLPEEGAR
ncbi:MAG: TolC family protein [Dokdonella sp.]